MDLFLKEKNILNNLSTRIRLYRLNANLTQKEFSEKAKISRSTLQKLETGDGNITLKALIQILCALEMENNFDLLVPEIPVSPLELAKRKGKQKKRVYHQKEKSSKENWVWGEDK
jgi:putative transcriptional regulator